MVTGGTGQLGGAVEALWKCDSWKDWQAVFPSKNDFDLSNEELVRGYIRAHQPNILLHAGAYTDVESAEGQKDLAFLVNAQANVWIAEECAKIGCWLIYISTDYVFDGQKNTPYLETDPTYPLSSYGKSKLAGEVGIPRFAAIREFRKRHLIATGRGGLAARSGAGDGVEDALELEVHRGAEALLNIGPLSFDGDATVRFAVVGIFIGDGIFGADVTRSEPDEERGEGERAKVRKRRGGHERASGERA